MENKKPDIVVWSKEKGWYSKSLPYGSNVGAPSIKPDNISAWRQSNIKKANDYFKTKWEEMRKDYNLLLEEMYWNEMVYEAKYNFSPIIGEVYHLYRDETDGLFLSIINPKEWSNKPFDYIGSFRFDSKNKWEKINFDS